MTALETLEREAAYRGVTRVAFVVRFSEEPSRRYRCMPVNGTGFTVEWHYGPTPEAAMERMVRSLPSRDVVLFPRDEPVSDVFYEGHPYRRTA